ncbi:hypothetical protein [Flindersiella endophytica]
MTNTADGLFEAPVLPAVSGAPEPPAEPVLDPDAPLTKLQVRLRTVLAGLPAHFEFHNQIAGVNATDLHSLNTLLGTSIEGQVVKTLNQARPLWDPDNDWLGYTFERQAQRFPDVRLVRKGGPNGVDVALGIELKGWFLLAKEGEPSFRFTTTPAACADHDLLVVVPWYLDNVLSGAPVAAEPYVASAKWAATYRNHYWQHTRDAAIGADRTINAPPKAHPYPGREAQIADQPAYDGGKNFGRVARVPGLMNDFVQASNELEVLGIRIGDWYKFLRTHSDQADPDEVSDKLDRTLRLHLSGRAEHDVTEALQAVQRLGRALGG